MQLVCLRTLNLAEKAAQQTFQGIIGIMCNRMSFKEHTELTDLLTKDIEMAHVALQQAEVRHWER